MPVRVSVVEDDQVLREALADIIGEDTGLELSGAYQRAEEFLEALEDGAADVVIMDITLPGIDGTEAVRRAKGRHPATQFLMCTVRDDDDSLFEAIRAGATGYIVKDAEPEKVVAAVKDLHAGGSPMSPGIARRMVLAFQKGPEPTAEIHRLTERERQVLQELAQGYRYKEIADRLAVSMDTVRTHVRNLYAKLQVSSRTDALNKLYPR